MLGRTAAVITATVVTVAASATVVSAAGAPPPPTAANGATVTLVAAGLNTPTSFAFGNGAIFEGDGGADTSSGPPNGGVFLLKGGKGIKISGSPQFVGGLAWNNGTLYISGGTLTSPTTAKWQLLAWSGWNGTAFTTQKVVWTAPKKLDGLNGVAVGPDGRVYVGVDLGLTDNNDHGPAGATPFLYDILSINPDGTGLKVFASGIRQPWQFAFNGSSATPFVSALGQDKGATNPPDFVLKVRKGDNYGFPKCNQTVASKCKGFAKPFKTFGPHSDIMGLAIIGNRLYMTSFTGLKGKGPGGEVVSMPLSGGAVTPVLTGFVAPTVGLGENAGTLYVGEVTGQVFSVTP